MIQHTSVEALRRVSPKISKSQQAVLDVMRAYPEGLTDAEINHYLQWTINRVTPRRGELLDKGLIVYGRTRECRKTHSHAKAYKAKVPVLPPAFPEKPKAEKNPNELF